MALAGLELTTMYYFELSICSSLGQHNYFIVISHLVLTTLVFLLFMKKIQSAGLGAARL